MEQDAIGQIGERIVVRHVGELALRFLDLRDVGIDRDIAGRFAVLVVYGVDRDQFRCDGSVSVAVDDLSTPLAGVDDRSPHGSIEGLVVQL